MYMRLSHGYVTKIQEPTPDGPSKGGWGSPFKKKSGAAIFFAGCDGTPRGWLNCEGGPPLASVKEGVPHLMDLFLGVGGIRIEN